MDADEARRRILVAGRSGELTAAIQNVAEVTVPSGERKYARKVCNELGRMIVCRSYAKAVLQLCHLINAADACGRGAARYERFFFGSGRATAGSFRSYVDNALCAGSWRRGGFEYSAEGIVIRYRDALFNVGFSRMPALAALLEFLMTTETYSEVDEIFTEMLDNASSDAAIRRAANAISLRLHHYLSRHLPSAQNAAKFSRILEFLKGRMEDESILIDDRIVLDFWHAHALSDDKKIGNFRAFRTVLDAFVNFMRALELADDRIAIDRARPIGSNREAGEVDPEALSGMVDLPDDWRSPLLILSEEPVNRIKFLTNRQQETLRLLLDAGPMSRRLPLSLLRSEVFGRVQSRITQALRRKSGGDEVLALIQCRDAVGYATFLAAYEELNTQIERVMKAALYVLLPKERRSPGGVVADPSSENVISLFAQTNVFSAASGAEEFQEEMIGLTKAFQGLSRKGFDQADLDDPEVIEGFRLGANALRDIAQQVDSFLDTLGQLDRGEPSLAEWFHRDVADFRDQFQRLYAEVT